MELLLQADFRLRRSLGVRTFPSLVLADGDDHRVLLRGYGTADEVLRTLA